MRKSLTIAILAIMVSGTAAAGTLTAIHGIPGDSVAEGLDRALPVDVYVNQSYAAPAFTFSFGDMLEGIELPAGEYSLEVFLAGADPNESDPVLSAAAPITEEGNFTAVAHLTYTGDPEAPGIALSLFENETSATHFIDTRLSVRHLANAPAVTLDVERYLIWWAGVRFPGFANTDEVVLDTLGGPITVYLLAGGAPVYSTGLLQLSSETHYLAYAIGDFFKGSFQVLLQVID